jgi:glycyl-tRNA synthetase beta subunit
MPPLPKERDKDERKEARDKFQRAVERATSSPRFGAALEAFEEDPERAKPDAKGFLKEHGVELPDDATVEVVEQEGSYCYCIRVCVGWWCWSACVCVG